MLPFPKRGQGYIIAAYLRCTCKCTKTLRKMCINTMKVFHIYMFQNKHASICICWLDQDGKILNFFSIIHTVHVSTGICCNTLYMLMVWKSTSFSGNLVLPNFMIKFKHILLRNQMDCVTGKAYVNPLQITKSRSEVNGFISYAFI